MAALKSFAVVSLIWLTVIASVAHADSNFISLNKVYAYSGSTGQLLSTTQSSSSDGPSPSLSLTSSSSAVSPATPAAVAAPAAAPAPVETPAPTPVPVPVAAPAPTPTPVPAPVEAPAPAPTPVPVAAPVSAPIETPASAPAPVATPAAAPQAAAFINFGTATYADASSLATGTSQSWYESPVVAAAFGHTPNAAEQTQFRQAVLQDIDKTYQLSGIAGAGNPVSGFYVTDDPNVSAAHMMSVASGVTALNNSQAIGLTSVGTNGFSFLDQFGPAAGTGAGDPVANLEWAVAHNLSHELMHAFGVANHPDTTGTYLDAAGASWSQLTDPNFKLSPAAVQAILSSNEIYKNVDGGSQYGYEMIGHPRFCQCPLCRALLSHDHRPHGAELATGDASTVPEPTTLAMWGLAGVAVVSCRGRSRRVA